MCHLVVPRHIADQVLDMGKSLHRANGDDLILGGLGDDIAHSRHAHQEWFAINLSTARATFSSLAIPSAGDLSILLVLDLVDAVEQNHTLVQFDLIVDQFAFAFLAAEYAHGDLIHLQASFFFERSSNFSSSSGGWSISS